VSAVDFLSLLSTAQAWASEAGHGAHPGPTISDVILPALNFLLYIFIIVKFALPLVRDFLRTRRDEVITTISQASAKKQAAEALVGEYTAKLRGLDREVELIQASLREEGEREKVKLLGETASLAAKIKEDANFLADQEVRMARQRMREDIAEQAVITAQELVQRNLSAADQVSLAEDFIRNIGQAR
jgi:F-type H+-transporting ATPase subunit b